MDSIKEKIEEIIGNNYGAFKPFIVLVLLYTYERFEYTEDEVLDETKNLLTHLDNIRFISNMKGAQVAGTAHYGNIFQNNGGNINIRDFYKDKQKVKGLINIIVHELCHSKSYRRRIGLKKYKKIKFKMGKQPLKIKTIAETFHYIQITILNRYGIMMMEVYNEMASNMIVNNGRKIEDWYNPTTFGYKNYTFLPSLISGALGYTDFELTKEASRSLTRYDKKVFAKFKKDNKKRVSKILKDIQVNFDWLRDIENEENEADAKVNKMKIVRAKRNNLLASIYNDCLDLASIQIKDDIRPIDDDFTSELQIRAMKMRKSIVKAIELRNINKKEKNDILIKVQDKSLYFTQLKDINIINKYKNVFDRVDLKKYSRNG